MNHTFFGYVQLSEDYAYHIYYDENKNIILRNCLTQLFEDNNAIDALGYCLSNPWDKIEYYIDKNGNHHWLSNVHDTIKIDIWGKNIVDMMNNVSCIFKDCIDFLTKQNDEY